MRLALLLLLGALVLNAQYNGLGASTVTCLDKDGDGYGVGTTCTARDADDDDPTVHTATEATTKWGSMAAFLSHRGYNPLRIWYIDDGGNNTSCNANPRDINFPCATFANIQGSIVAGDLIFYRAGTYTERLIAKNAVTGTSANPIIYMAYPGETAIIDNTTSIDVCASGFTPQNRDYIVFDGFILDGDISTGSEAANLCYNDHVTFRYNEARDHGRGFFGSFMTNTTIEYNVSHDTNGGSNPSHTLYFGARETPLDGVVIRYNIFWNPGRSCLQLNGRFNSPVIDGNWCYGYDSTAGISLEMGVNGAQVRNNIVWNGQAKPFVMYNYPNQTACGISTIQPYDMQNNVIENNTFVIPQKTLAGGTFAGSPNIQIAVEVDYGETYSFAGTVFRNNVIINHSGYVPVVIQTASMDCLGHVSTAGGYRTRGYIDPRTIAGQLTWQNNIVYQTSTTGKMLWTHNTQTTFGTPPATPALIDQDYTFVQWQAVGTNTGNLNTDPLVTSYDHAWYATPGNFNFRPTASSPAVNSGHTSTAATRDVVGHNRTVTPSVGAYQYASGGTSLGLNTWVSATSRGATHGANGWDRMAYARSAKKAVLWGMFQENSTEPNQAIGGFDFESRRWDILDTNSLFHGRGLPEAGHNQSIAYDSATGTIWNHISGSGSNAYENRWYTYQYDPVGQMGRLRQGLTKPNLYANYQSTAAFDSTNNRYVIWTGSTFTYNPTTDVWTQQSPTCSVACPPTMYNASMEFNSSDGKIYLFGGSTSGTGGTNQDVYTYNVATNTWTRLAPSGTKPSARWKAAWKYDSLNNIFLLWGGETGLTSGILNDTWVFNPSGSGSWTQLSPAASPSVPSSSPWERMIYDSDHNVFVLFLNDSTGTYAAGSNACCSLRAWFYRYAGPGPDIGMLNVTVSPASGGLNEQSTGWAKEPVVTATGSTLYTAWSEMDKPDTVATQSRWAHVFAKSFASSWADVGGSYNSIGSENSGSLEMHMPSLAYVNSELWASYIAALPPTVGLEPVVYAKRYSGGAWVGGTVGKVNNVAGVYQSRSSLSSISTTPYIALIEVDKSGGLLGQKALVYLKSFNGSSWVNVNGGAAINRDGGACDATNCTIANSVSTATSGTNLYVAFTEHLTNNATVDTAGKVYVSRWSGSALTTMGGALNNSTSCFPSDVTITYMGQPYVAWTERCAAGVNKLFVKTTSDGSTWTLAGSGALNKDATTGWAMNPSISNDGTNVFLAWSEQQAIGQKPKVYAMQYASGSWSDLGSSLNKSTSGSAQGPAIAVRGGLPVVAWGEVEQGAYRNVYAKEWSGFAWGDLGSGASSSGTQHSGRVSISGSGRIQ